MRIISVIISSRCKDGSLVKEYSLMTAACDDDIDRMKHHGEIIIKDLGGNRFFTFSSELFSIKGMIGDSILYVTHKKEDSEAVEHLINQLFC